jgi:hypothetical protein
LFGNNVAVIDAEKCDEIDGKRSQAKARQSSTRERCKEIETHESEQVSLRRRASFCAGRRHGGFTDGAQEVIEGIRGLRAGQNADDFAVIIGAARATQHFDGEDATQQLRPQHARSSTVRGIGIIDGVFERIGAVMPNSFDFGDGCVIRREGTSERPEFTLLKRRRKKAGQ